MPEEFGITLQRAGLFIFEQLNYVFGRVEGMFDEITKKVFIPEVSDAILVMPTHLLAEKIRKRELSSEEVVRAFVDRAKLVNTVLNAIIDERFEDAIEEAKSVDAYLKTTELTEEQLAEQKPFLGLPFTVKDSIKVTGMRWSSGCVRRKDLVANEDAPVVANYKKAGAIPFAITNVPELLLWFATSNKLYGTTNNPFNPRRTPGGSSGGEAALMSAAGTPLSICSDIGGSIRMPAFYCGLFGHKPTHRVIDWHGTFPEITEDIEDIFSFGPITRYADDIVPALKVMAGDNFHKFRDLGKAVDMTKLKVYYIDQSDCFMTTQVESYIQRSIRWAAEHLSKKYGIPCERAKFENLKYISLWYTLLFSSSQEVSSLITENTYKINPFLELAKYVVGKSDFSPSALTVAAAQSTVQAACNTGFTPDLHGRALETLKLAQKEFAELLGDNGILICASLPRTAPFHQASVLEFTNICYPMLMNYLGAPTTQVPVDTEHDMPFGIQIAATPFNDRNTIAAAKELEQLFGGWLLPFEGKRLQAKYRRYDTDLNPESCKPETCLNLKSEPSSSEPESERLNEDIKPADLPLPS